MATRANTAATRIDKMTATAKSMAQVFESADKASGYGYVASEVAALAQSLGEETYGNPKFVSEFYTIFHKQPQVKAWEKSDGRERRFFLAGNVGSLWDTFVKKGKTSLATNRKTHKLDAGKLPAKVATEGAMTIVGRLVPKLIEGKLTQEDFKKEVLKAPNTAVINRVASIKKTTQLQTECNMGVRAYTAAKMLSKVLIGASTDDNANPLVLSEDASPVERTLNNALTVLMALAIDDKATELSDKDVGKFLPEDIGLADIKKMSAKLHGEWSNGAVESDSTDETPVEDETEELFVEETAEEDETEELPDDVAALFEEEMVAFKTRLAKRLKK